MARLGSSFRVNEPDVIAESVDGEVLIINLRSGAYYSSDGTGNQIWLLLARHATVGAVVNRLSGNNNNGEQAQFDQAVLAFVDELEREGLIVEQSEPKTVGDNELPAEDVSTSGLPILNKYTDFQELLLLDPIHEVDESIGWPVPRQAD